ncbi:MAG TPA: methyltransferase domain-containing protein [Spirochaetia bacterium]|nr:methyltransferase domain-containing protein [Spirochaetia bacterium]
MNFGEQGESVGADFYRLLSRYYDELFPREESIVEFLREQLRGRRRVLDIGCATGTYSCALAAAGHKVTGIDSDASMIERANAIVSCPAVFVVGDMRRIRELAPGPWDAICCIGNTLVHLSSRVELARFLTDVRGVLTPGGLFVAQIVNFDRILDSGIRALPALPGREASMEREYSDLDEEGRISFRATIRDSRDPAPHTMVTSLLALRSGELREECVDAGLEPTLDAGSYRGEAYSALDSYLSILVAVKPL